jgi:fibronectin-binding autotransporter adhesin
MSYNILNKNVNFQGATKGTVEDLVDTHSSQAVTGSKDFNSLTGSSAFVRNKLSIGTHANDHVVNIAGAVSASLNISASGFYVDGALLTGGGAVSAVANGVNNRIATFSSSDALNGEANLTFNGTVLDFKDTSISGSGNISGSQFYGNGANLVGVQTALKTGGGLTYNSNELEINFSTMGSPAGGIDGANDKILIYDDNASVLRQVTANTVANLFSAAVTSYTGDTDNRVITSGGSKALVGEATLTFDGTDLSLTGNMSGSGTFQVGGNIKIEQAPVEAPNIAQDHVLFTDAGDHLVTKCTFSNLAAALAGDGLAQSSNTISIQTSGAIHITSDKVALTGSFAGVGLSFGGGPASISEIKFDPHTLPEVAINRANDYIVFIDADDNNPKKEQLADLVGFVAGSGLDASSGQLSVDVSDFLSNGANNRLVTAGDADSLNAEANLSFDGNTLVITGSMEMSGSGTLTAGESITFGNDQMTIFAGSALVHPFTGNDAGATIPTTRTYQRIDANGSARTGMRFATAGTKGQFLIVDNEGGENVTFDSDAATAKITTNTDNDTMMPGEVFTFISNGTQWFLVGGDLQAG